MPQTDSITIRVRGAQAWGGFSSSLGNFTVQPWLRTYCDRRGRQYLNLPISMSFLLRYPGMVPSLRISMVATLVIDGTESPLTCVWAWTEDFSIATETTKLLKGNIGGKLLDIGLGNDFYFSPNHRQQEQKSRSRSPSNEKASAQQRKPATKLKRQPTEWEKTSVNHKSD